MYVPADVTYVCDAPASGRKSVVLWVLSARGAARAGHWKERGRKAPAGRGGEGPGWSAGRTLPVTRVSLRSPAPPPIRSIGGGRKSGEEEEEKKLKAGSVGDGPAIATPRPLAAFLPRPPTCPAAIRHEVARGHRIFSPHRLALDLFATLANTPASRPPLHCLVHKHILVFSNQMLENARRDGTKLRVGHPYRICSNILYDRL